MSRYSYHGQEPSYHLAVGWDPMRGSFFGQLWPHPTEEDDTPLFIVGDEEIITDLSWLDAQLTPYGNIPSSIQPSLLRDWKQHHPHPRAPELVQFQRRVLSLTEAISPRYYILIDPHYGWQTRYMSRLPADEQERRAVYRSLLAGADPPPETVAIQAITDALPAAFTSAQLLVDQLGTVKRLPPTVFIEPDYLLVGPIVVLGPEGLSELQVQQLREVIIVVDDSVRDEVARHFYGHRSPEYSPGERS
jgi:hypothetical protein